MEEEIIEIFERVTERYEIPVRIGSRCESNTYYHVDDLSEGDVETCGQYIADRIIKVCQPVLPELLIQLEGSRTGLAEILAKELAPAGEELEIIQYHKISTGNGVSQRIKNSKVALVNDVITTARSCIETHTKITMMGSSILCWAALIDRTFGPGPVPVVASHTGEPITLLEEKFI